MIKLWHSHHSNCHWHYIRALSHPVARWHWLSLGAALYIIFISSELSIRGEEGSSLHMLSAMCYFVDIMKNRCWSSFILMTICNYVGLASSSMASGSQLWWLRVWNAIRYQWKLWSWPFTINSMAFTLLQLSLAIIWMHCIILGLIDIDSHWVLLFVLWMST